MAKITPVNVVRSLFDNILKAPQNCEFDLSIFKPTLEFSSKLFDEFRELYKITMQVKPNNFFVLSGDITDDRYFCGLKHELAASYFGYDELGFPEKKKSYELNICKNQLQGDIQAVCKEFHQYQSVLNSVLESLDTLAQSLVTLNVNLLHSRLNQLAIKNLLFRIEWFNDLNELEELTVSFRKHGHTTIEFENEKLFYLINISDSHVIFVINSEESRILTLTEFKQILQTKNIPFDLDSNAKYNLLRMLYDLKYALERFF